MTTKTMVALASATMLLAIAAPAHANRGSTGGAQTSQHAKGQHAKGWWTPKPPRHHVHRAGCGHPGSNGGSTSSSGGNTGNPGSTSSSGNVPTSTGGSSFGTTSSGTPSASSSGTPSGTSTTTGGSTGGIAVPEPADFALFLLGVTGLIVGRRASRARQRRAQEALDG